MKKIVCATLLALTVGGCATVTRGTTNQITFSSEPSDARVRTSLGHTCTTPCTLEISRKSDFIATFELDKYKTMQIPVQTRVAGSGAAGFAGNLIVGGIIGMGVDAATGSTLEHFPNPVFANFEKPSTDKGPTRERAKKLQAGKVTEPAS